MHAHSEYMYMTWTNPQTMELYERLVGLHLLFPLRSAYAYPGAKQVVVSPDNNTYSKPLAQALSDFNPRISNAGDYVVIGDIPLSSFEVITFDNLYYSFNNFPRN